MELHKLVEGLNQEQLKAVTYTYDKNTLVVAGAGSGKTNVLTKRIAFIVGNNYSTDSIAAITFTNKAADEMRKRVALYIGKDNAKKILIGTFHSIGVKLLREFGKEIGIPKYFNIYDTKDTKQIMKECLIELYNNYDETSLKKYISYISKLKNNLITVKDYCALVSNAEEQNIALLYDNYQHKLKSNNALDFDDIIMNTVLLLQHSYTALNYCHNRFKFVMVDEVQDTNNSQFLLIDLIAGNNNIFMVGDTDQSIYGWRGANIDNIINFTGKYPNSQIIALEHNYRSTQTIVNASNHLISNNKNRIPKNSFSTNRIGDPIYVYTAKNDRYECNFIINEIKSLIQNGKQFKDITVLYRVNRLTRELEDQLMNNNIPYEIISGLSFYSRKEIKDIISILKSAINPYDNISFKRYLSITPRVGKRTIEQLISISNKNNLSIFESINLFQGNAKIYLIKAVNLLNILVQSSNNSPKMYIKNAIELTGYSERLQLVNSEENLNRLSNLEELLNVSTQFEEINGKTSILEFLDRISLSSDNDIEDTEKINKVKLMTVHSAKGLENDIVFIIGCEEGLFPHKNAIDNNDIEEERRAFYVAMTRAKQRLYITNSFSRLSYGIITSNKQSRFINEIPNNFKVQSTNL